MEAFPPIIENQPHTFYDFIEVGALNAAQCFKIFDEIDGRLKCSYNFLFSTACKTKTCQRANRLHIVSMHLWPCYFMPCLKCNRNLLNNYNARLFGAN